MSNGNKPSASSTRAASHASSGTQSAFIEVELSAKPISGSGSIDGTFTFGNRVQVRLNGPAGGFAARSVSLRLADGAPQPRPREGPVAIDGARSDTERHGDLFVRESAKELQRHDPCGPLVFALELGQCCFQVEEIDGIGGVGRSDARRQWFALRAAAALLAALAT